MKRWIVLIAMVLFTGFFVQSPAQVEVEEEFALVEVDNDLDQMPGPGMGAGMDLTDEQRAKMLDMHLALMRELLPLKSKVHDLKIQLRLQLASDNYDARKVDALLDQIFDLEKQIRKKHLEHMRAVRDMLTPEQRKKFDAAVLSGKHFGGKKMMRMHHMKGPRGEHRRMPPRK